jgi:hypothetical protein
MVRFLTLLSCLVVSVSWTAIGPCAYAAPADLPGCSCAKKAQDCIPPGYACSLSDEQNRQTVRIVTECGPANGKKCVPTKWADRPLSELAQCTGVVAAVKGDCRATKAGTYLVATLCSPSPCSPKQVSRTFYCEKEEEFAGQDGLVPVQDSCGQCKDAASCNSATCSFVKIPKGDCTKRDGNAESAPCAWSASGSPRVVTSPAPVISPRSY